MWPPPLLLLLLPLAPLSAENCEFFTWEQKQYGIKFAEEYTKIHLRCEVEASTDSCKRNGYVWYRNGLMLHFNESDVARVAGAIVHRNDKRLEFTQVTQSASGNYSCRFAHAQPSAEGCQFDSPACFPYGAVHFTLLTVAPAKRQLLPNYADFYPTEGENLLPGRVYLSHRTALQAEARVGERFTFQVFVMVNRKSRPKRPRFRWRKIGGHFEDNSTNFWRDHGRYKCNSADSEHRNRDVRCYRGQFGERAATGDSFGDYECLVKLGKFNFTLLLTLREIARQPLHISFNKNSTICSGDSFELNCRVDFASVNVAIVQLKEGEKPTYDLSNDSFRMLGLHRSVNNTIGNITLRQVTAAGDVVVAKLPLKDLTVEHSSYFACAAVPYGNSRSGSIEFMYLTVKPCRAFSALAFASVCVGVVLTMASILSIVFCVWFNLRRSGAPIVKRLRVVRAANEPLYARSRAATDSPLLEDTRTIFESSSGGFTLPEVVVERISAPARNFRRRQGESTEANKEVRYIIPTCPVMEIDRKTVHCFKEIGQGAFGSVLSGQIQHGGRTQDVAVKRLKPDYTEEELVALVKEMEIMRLMSRNSHPNIIRLIGVCTKNGPFMLLVELAHHGNLRDFLKARRPAVTSVDDDRRSPPPPYGNVKLPGTGEVLAVPVVTQLQLLRFCEHVASALEFMASISIVHRDIAARNILVDGVGGDSCDELVAKVADFGLTRNVQEKDYYRIITEGKLPVKWLAPECLHSRVFSTKSDVWAYGVLLYEIFSFGGVPYPGVSPSGIHQHLQKGGLNPQPEYASPEMYKLMLDCWQTQPSMRPNFSSLLTRVNRMRQLEESRHSTLCQWQIMN